MARILVIEDDALMREMLQEMLEAARHEVILARCGRDGLECYRREAVHLVITDILMPGVEGIQIIMELKRDHPEVRIIAISGGGAVGPDTYLAMAREMGADRTLTKPFPMAQLLQAVNDLL
jgi:DNA-binding response OmpR family regulator